MYVHYIWIYEIKTNAISLNLHIVSTQKNEGERKPLT